MDNQGWVKIHRKILEWEWYEDKNTTRLFIHLLLKANHKDKEWRGIVIKRGESLTGRMILSVETGLSEQQVRTSLKKLKLTNEITVKTTNRYSIITINNYSSHQEDNRQPNQQITNKEPTDNQQVTTNKKLKNEKNEKNIYHFHLFWDKYPKKVGKKKSKSIYKKIVKSSKIEGKIFKGLEDYIRKWNVEGTPLSYIPNPTTWLNQERWEDEVEIVAKQDKGFIRKNENNWEKKKQEEKNYYEQSSKGERYIEVDGKRVKLNSFKA